MSKCHLPGRSGRVAIGHRADRGLLLIIAAKKSEAGLLAGGLRYLGQHRGGFVLLLSESI